MPLYEYECLKCGTRFEQIQKFSDSPLSQHDGCGGEVRRLLSVPAIQFKGSGWYVTDYARAGNKKDDKGGKDEEKSKKTSEKSDKKADTKTQAKTSETSSRTAKS